MLSAEYFNGLSDRGRPETVLILMDRSFELLLKAIIVHRGGRIREPRAKETIGHDHCVRKCLTDAKCKCLTEDEAATIQIVNSLRDAAQHYILAVSERQLYIYAQAGFALFRRLLNDVFGDRLAQYIPERALPIATVPPQDLPTMLGIEFDEVKKLVEPGSRKRFQARAKLRSLAIVEASLGGERSQPSRSELDKIIASVQEGKKWPDLFPNVASLHLETDPSGYGISLRLTKKEGEAIHLVKEGAPGATVIAVKRVNELSYYSLGLNAVASKVGQSAPRTLALVRELDLQKDMEFFKVFKIGSTTHKRYSAKAVACLRDALKGVDMDEVWERNKPSRK